MLNWLYLFMFHRGTGQCTGGAQVSRPSLHRRPAALHPDPSQGQGTEVGADPRLHTRPI